MGFIRRILEYILGLFKSESLTPTIDKKIDENKEKIKQIDKDLYDEYDNVEDARLEWGEDD